MWQTTISNRGGLVTEPLAANVLLHAPVEPNHLVTAMVNVTTDQQGTAHVNVTYITMVLRAASVAIVTSREAFVVTVQRAMENAFVTLHIRLAVDVGLQFWAFF